MLLAQNGATTSSVTGHAFTPFFLNVGTSWKICGLDGKGVSVVVVVVDGIGVVVPFVLDVLVVVVDVEEDVEVSGSSLAVSSPFSLVGGGVNVVAVLDVIVVEPGGIVLDQGSVSKVVSSVVELCKFDSVLILSSLVSSILSDGNTVVLFVKLAFVVPTDDVLVPLAEVELVR